jgi:hypoxanthine-DNA glycosylase
MIEIHPFGAFTPPNSKFLLLGSFTTKPFDGYEWFYANGRNQFWPILENVYSRPLRVKKDQQILFSDLKMAITDVILKCKRTKNSNLDVNLKILEFNNKLIDKILKDNPVEKIYFTSKFVEKIYTTKFKDLLKKYPEIYLITLPSPSPRYAQMTKMEKISIYKKLLPSI